nr:protein ALP1-like isoform X1 [Tanacetum cinerariifolium]
MCIIDLFTAEFLRKLDVNNVRKLYDAHNRIHGLPRMLCSIDCMHWEWINCPKAWHGQFGRGDKKYPTIMLEVVASYDLWIWHAFFGIAGANNDLTVLNHSPLFDDLLDDIAPFIPFEVNGVTFQKGYYLADGIYPQWTAFVKSFTVARSERNAVFKRRQESARKDVERAFGVFQDRWHIIAQHARAWSVNRLRRIIDVARSGAQMAKWGIYGVWKEAESLAEKMSEDEEKEQEEEEPPPPFSCEPYWEVAMYM